MSQSEFENLLAVLIPGRGRIGVTLTEPPRDEASLLRLFDTALTTGRDQTAPLTAICAPISLYPNLGDTFWHVPIADAGEESVVRLTFAAPADEAA